MKKYKKSKSVFTKLKKSLFKLKASAAKTKKSFAKKASVEKVKAALRRPVKYLAVALSLTALTLASLAAALVVPQFSEQVHLDFLRSIKGASIVHIRAGNGTPERPFQWQGTGFYIKAPSGASVVVTNRHVCLGGFAAEPAKYISIQVEGRTMPAMATVLKIAQDTDLCMLEPAIPGVAPLTLAGSVRVGQLVYTLGHPKGQPLTVTKGETVGSQEIKIYDQLRSAEAEESCVKYRNNKVVDFATFFGIFRLCETTVTSAITTSIIKAGSSGSPAVNMLGDVVGVMFAAEADGVSWGFMVPLSHLEEFLAGF